MENNTAQCRQYFPYAAARESALNFAASARTIPVAAEYTSLISIAYSGLEGNSARHDLAPPANKAKIAGRDREELLESLLLDAPELTFTPRGNPDSRLLRLVDLLARQAARECYAEEVKMQKRRRKRTS